MLNGINRGNAGFYAPSAAFTPENVLLSGCGMTAAAHARRETTNNRGPIKGSHSVASRILRDATSGRMFEDTLIQEYV